MQMTCESCADKVRAVLVDKPGEKAFKGLPALLNEPVFVFASSETVPCAVTAVCHF